MNRNKRYQNIGDSSKKKLQCISSSSVTTINTNRNSVSHFEDLSSGLIYEIFTYFDTFNLYESFYDLNIRLRNLCTHPNLSIKIHPLSLSKSTFQRYYTSFILPNKHRIHSIHLSNPFLLDFFSSQTENISKCSQLQTLILDTIEPQYLENLLKNLISLPNLSSLAIPIHHSLNNGTIFNLIFQLPVLKYCKISFEHINIYLGLFSIPINKSNSIEHLIINGTCSHIEANALLSYVPQLRRLSMKLRPDYRSTQQTRTILNNLTHVSLTIEKLNFAELELIIKQYFSQVQVLYISVKQDSSCSDANCWEQLILSHMPRLRIFDFQSIYQVINNKSYEYCFQQFNNRFWFERKWLFAHDCNSGTYFQGNIYSIQPYRRKTFTLIDESNTSDRKTIFNSVHHVIIQNEKTISNCSKYFPNAYEFTISDHRNDRSRRSLSDNIDQIIPLVQLTKLTIDYAHRPFSKVIDLLYLTPNIETLIFKHLSLVSTDYFPLQQQSERFRLVSNQNKIKYIQILFEYSLRNIQLIINLCPKLEQISIGISNIHLESTIQFLLSEIIHKPICRLSSICIFGVDTILSEKLKTLIESEKYLDDYSIKIMDKTFFFWC